MARMAITFFFILGINISFASVEPPLVRVRIAKSLSTVRVAGKEITNFIFPKNLESHYQGYKTVQFKCMNSQYNSKSMVFASLSSNDGLLEFDNQKYQGKMIIISKDQGNYCDVVNETSMESYLSSLLAKEMNSSWPIEVLKAQAVAARTYAYTKIKNSSSLFDLESSERHQVGGQFFDANQTTVRAANSTKGEILVTESGKITPIFFHAKCGGKTLRPDQVWESKVAGYTSIICPFCNGHGKEGWSNSIPLERIWNFLGFLQRKNHIPKVFPGKIFVPYNDENKTQVRIYVGDKFYVFNKSLFRNYFGTVMVPSNNFKITQRGDKIELFGKGLGHGVGLCQLGGLDLAQKGYDYKAILSHYFPNHKLRKIY